MELTFVSDGLLHCCYWSGLLQPTQWHPLHSTVQRTELATAVTEWSPAFCSICHRRKYQFLELYLRNEHQYGKLILKSTLSSYSIKYGHRSTDSSQYWRWSRSKYKKGICSWAVILTVGYRLMRNFITCILRQIEWSSQGGWNGQGM
jgi:hypothetical protein